MVRYVKTFVKGFDKELGGGIPYGHLVLISGSPGTMKSTLAYSIMYNNVIKSNMSGAYISLEQSAPSLTFHLNQAGLKPSMAVKEKVQIIDLARIRKELKEDPKKEVGFIKDLIREALDAGFYQIDVDSSTLVTLEPDG